MPSTYDTPFLCRTFISSAPLDLHPGFSIDSLSAKAEHAVYVSPETTALDVLQVVWRTLPDNLKTTRARYHVKSLFALDDRERPGSLSWRTRNLADFTHQDVIREGADEQHTSKSKTLSEARFRSNDSLYISVHLPPMTGGPLANGPGASFSVRGSASRPEGKAHGGFMSNDGPAAGAGGVPQGEGSWIEARKDHPPARGNHRNATGQAGARGRPAPAGTDRYFDSRQRSRSPVPRRGGGGARRPSPSY